MKDILFKNITKGKKRLALLLAMVLAVTGIGDLGFVKDKNTVHAGETGVVYFAEGFGTGTDFSKSRNSWNIQTNFASGAHWNYKNDSRNQAGIVNNNHSGSNEPIIRLINGVQNANLSSGDSDYRAGTAISTQKIRLNNKSEFSAKFTISMPDACVNSVQTGGTQHSREVGGDGIAFIITPNNTVNGQAGGGIGYYGVNNSIVVELDSYFNGAYCTFATSDTAYINWDYDNQIYANWNYEYLSDVANSNYKTYNYKDGYADYWNNLLNPKGYQQLPGSSTRRFDHVGVMVDGDPKKHLGISYLNGLNPSQVSGNRYVNISNSDASKTSSDSKCDTRFADEGNRSLDGEGVDNRLFTFWIEYDGTNMYVSYANGNFKNAVRPTSPQIAIIANPNLVNKFAGQDVNVGFTSAIGSSKANHTVHSVAFVNKYLKDGIKASYTEKYYVETPDATKDFITVDGKKYVEDKTQTEVQTNQELGFTATIKDKSGEAIFADYDEVDYSDNPLYPKTKKIANDGSTVLYQFFDLKTVNYKEMYYLEDPSATEGAADVVKIGNTKYKLQSAYTATKSSKVGTNVTVTDLSTTTFKNYDLIANPSPDYTESKEVKADGSTVVYQFYNLKEYNYKVEYYLEAPEGTVGEIQEGTKWYNRVKDYDITKSAKYGTNIKVGLNSDSVAGVFENDTKGVVGTFRTINDYSFNSTATEFHGKSLDTVISNDSIIRLFYDKKAPTTTTFKAKYYLELKDQTETGADIITIPYNGKDIKFKLSDDKGYTSGSVSINSIAKIIDESDYFNEYDLMEPTLTYPSKIAVTADAESNVVYQIYRLKPKYTVKYYTEVSEGTSGAKKVNVNGIDKYYKLENVTFEKIVENETWVTFKSIINTGRAGVCENNSENDVVEGSEKGFSGYEFSFDATNANGNYSDLVCRDDEIIIELFYNKLPSYTVKYYVEVNATEKYDVSINVDGNVKYYIAKTDETYNKEVLTGTNVQYAVDASNKAGVKENGTNVDETFKSFTGFNFSDDYTEEYNKVNGTVSGTKELVIELFYNKKLTSYREKYYIEVIENPNDGSEIDTIGDKIYKVITNVIPNVPIDTKAVIRDKSNEYKGYKLLDPTVEKPSVVEDIDDTGKSVVYQVYDLPTYEIKYYIEVPKGTKGAIPVGENEYLLQSLDTVTNTAVPGTEVKSAKKDNATVTVKEGEKEVANKSYDKYEFSQSSTDANGKSSITVKKDGNVVELFFDLLPKYKVQYFVEVSANEKYDVQVGEGTDAKYYILKDSLTNDAYSDTKVEYDTDSDNKAGVKENGDFILKTFKKFTGFSFSKDYTEKNKHTEGIVSKLANLTINLFFNKNLTKYTEKYYIEVEDIPDDGSIVDTIGEKTYKVITNVKSKVPVDSKAVITDKSNEYEGYKLLDPTPSKPWVVEDIDDDGKTVVYQVYDLPTYTVNYYKEVQKGTEGAEKVGDKYYKLEEAVVNKVEAGTELIGVEKDIKTAVVKEGNEEVKNTLKSYKNYEFSMASTETRGKKGVKVSKDDNKNVIELFYDLLPSYAVKYYVEVKANEKYDISVDVDGNVKYYVIKTEETYEKEALTGTEVEYAVDASNKAGVKENGTNVNETFKSFDKYDFSDAYTVKYNKIKGKVSGTEELVIELFYNKKLTTFEMIYMTEVVNPLPTDVVVTEGEKKYKVETVVIPNVPIDSEAVITDKSKLPQYTGYNLLEPTPAKPSIVEDVDDNGLTKVYQVYDLPIYTVNYYIEVPEGTEGAEKVGEKYYKFEESEENKATYGTIVQYVGKDDKVTAGVKEGENEVAKTFKSYNKYVFSSDATETRKNASIKVTRGAENLVELFYNKKTTTYEMIYMTEVVNPLPTDVVVTEGEKKYKVETEVIPNVPIDSEAVITDKSKLPQYTGYNLLEPTPAKPSIVEDVDDNGLTKVYQVYDLPIYTVNYYIEVPEGTEGAEKVGEKYYKFEESEENKATYETIVQYVGKDDKVTAGVKEGENEVAKTFKSYDKYVFSSDATEKRGKSSIKVTKAGENLVELFYDKVKYKEKYWVEDPNATKDFIEIEIKGETKKFVLKETEDKEDATAGGIVNVTDKSEDYLSSKDYANYELVDVVVPNYPSSDSIKEDGSTVVHQIYVLKPTYEVQYYVEVEEKKDNAIEVDGKFYVIKSEESITKYASTGTIVNAATNADKAGVKEADVEITDTFKKFVGYTFSKKSTDANGKIKGEVTHDNNVVIMLMYDLVDVPEETTTPQPTTPSKPVSTGDNVSSLFMILILCSGFVVMVLMAGKKKSEN